MSPRGVDYKIPLADLLDAAERHERGWSLRFIAKANWRRWGYASHKSALEGLRLALRAIDRPVRDRIDATVLASTMHGDATRAARYPDHPDHQRFLAHRREVRKEGKAMTDEQQIRALWNEHDRWAFYQASRRYPATTIARALGIPVHVVQTRRRDLRRMDVRAERRAAR